MANTYKEQIAQFVFNPKLREFFELIKQFKTPVNAVAATGTLTIAAQATAGDTMTIGNKTYTFVANGTANDNGEINVGTDLATCKAAILAAIAGSDGVNTAHTQVTASAFSGNNSTITAITKGAAGNAIVTTETFTNVGNVFGGVVLAGGVNGTTGVAGDICIDSSYFYILLADNTISDANWARACINGNPTAETVTIDKATSPELIFKENGNTKWKIYSNSSDSDKLVIYNDDGTENAIEVDANSNVKFSDGIALGTSPLVWNGGYKPVEGAHSGVALSTTDGILRLYSNGKYIGANEVYSKGAPNEAASQIYMYNGVIYFLTAPSGNAGDTITFTERMKITSSGVDIANGATGSFTTVDGKTVTVTDGIITNIV